MGAHFQQELNSHASKTAVFDLKKQDFRLPVFFTIFQFMFFRCFFLGLLNLFDAGLIYATKAPQKKSR